MLPELDLSKLSLEQIKSLQKQLAQREASLLTQDKGKIASARVGLLVEHGMQPEDAVLLAELMNSVVSGREAHPQANRFGPLLQSAHELGIKSRQLLYPKGEQK